MPSLETSRQRAKDEKLQAHRIDDTTYRVYNVIKGTSYDVIKSRGGVWSCTCPFATKGSHITPGVCKHLCRVLDREAGCIECGINNEPLKDRMCAQCRFHKKMGL